MELEACKVDRTLIEFLRDSSYIFEQTSSESCMSHLLLMVLKDLDTVYVKAVEDREIRGTILGIIFNDMACLSYLCVTPSYRSRGITKSLTSKIESELQGRGIEKGYCLTTIPLSDNVLSLRSFYMQPKKTSSPVQASSNDFHLLERLSCSVGRLSWKPTEGEFETMLPLIQVHGDEKALTIHDFFVSNHDGRSYLIDYIALVLGDASYALQDIRSTSRADMIMGYEVGVVTKHIIEDPSYYRSPTTQVLSLIGIQEKYAIEDISLVLL